MCMKQKMLQLRHFLRLLNPLIPFDRMGTLLPGYLELLVIKQWTISADGIVRHMDEFNELPVEDYALVRMIKTEQEEVIVKLIQTLPEEDRELLRLRFLADMSYPEIARFLHRNEDAG